MYDTYDGIYTRFVPTYRLTDRLFLTNRPTDRNQKTDKPTESTVKSCLTICVQCGIPAGSKGIPQDPTPNASVRLLQVD